MGRGLSDLQRTALRLALQNRDGEGRTERTRGGADVYFQEILAAHYGWELKRFAGKLRSPGGQKFSKAGIGHREYNAATTAVSRAAARLEQRGLVERMVGAISNWAGFNLTPAGVEEARRLSDTSFADRQKV